MKSVYVFGPIHLYGEDYLPIYKEVSQLASKYFDKVIGTYPDFWDSKETPQEFYQRTYETITSCDLFIAEVTAPSSGVGMELQMGQEHGIPCFGICKEGKKPSSMVLGIPNMKEIIYYKDLEDLLLQLKEKLKEFSV